MEDYISQITSYLWTQSWQIAVLVVVIAAAALALKSKSAHVRYLLWLIVLAKCLVPPLLTIPLAVLPEEKPAMALETMDTRAGELSALPSAPLTKAPVPILTERPASLTIRECFGFGWFLCTAVFILAASIKALRTNLWLWRERKPLPGELQTRITASLANLDFAIVPKVWLVDGIGQPFVWGFLRGSIYLPGDFVKADSAEHRRDVLGHELSHVQRFDAAVNILQVIAQAIFWFHPFVWWANKKIRAEREKCCDEMTIARLGAKAKDYSTAIVNTLIAEHESTRPVPSLAIAGPAKNIEERIKTVMKPGKKFYKHPSAIVVITILLLAALAVPTTLALTKRESDLRTPTTQNANLEILDVKFEPIRQGKNVVRVKIQNTSEEEQMFRIHIYTRSPDYGRSGVGWGTPFYERIKPKETKWTRFVFKIQGPITNATYIRLTFHNPGPAETFDEEKWWAQNQDRQTHLKKTTYKSSQLKKLRTDGKLPTPALKKYHEAIIAAFRQIQDHIKNGNYEQAWKLFTKDYQDAEYQHRADSLERFKKAMEPAHPIDSAFLWEKDDFLNLQPKAVVERDGVLTLTATSEDQSWTIEFVREDGQWKIDWIAGYRPRILQWQNWEERLLATMKKRSTKQFDIYYFKDSTAEKEIDQIAEQKEKGFQEVCRFLGKGSDVRIRMILFEDGQTKHRETGHQGMGWAYGNTIVEVYNEKEKLDPYHETTHVLMRPFGNPPALFNEGFAVYMSERLGAHALKNLGGGLAMIHQRVRGLKEQGQWIDLVELVTYTEIGSRESRPPISYAEAASFVKLLIDKYGKDKFLRAYKALENSDDKGVHKLNRDKLADIYGKSLQQLEKQWQDTLAASRSPNSFPTAVPEDTNAGKSLHQAAADGDLEQVKSLIAKGVDINARDKEGRTALTLAKENEHEEIVVLLRMHEAKEDLIKIDLFLLSTTDTREVKEFLERENLEPSHIQGDPNTRAYVLNAGQVEQLQELTRLNADYKVLMAPTLEVIDGKTANVSSSAKRDYVSGYSEPNRPSEEPKPIQESVEIRNRLQVIPRLLPDSQDTMKVYFEFEISQFTGYEKHMYKEKYPYEIPIIQKIAMAAHYQVASGETLLLCGWKITDKVDGRSVKKELLILIKNTKIEPENVQGGGEIVEVRRKNGAKE
jgi:beta-lactamase regulating signal transducer with metallopeptidase domain